MKLTTILWKISMHTDHDQYVHDTYLLDKKQENGKFYFLNLLVFVVVFKKINPY